MTQENKELLLKDLCARLPYGVKVQIKEEFYPYTLEIIANDYSVSFIEEDLFCNIHIEEIKPYLFPLSSMTEEQRSFLHKNPNGIYIQLVDNILIKVLLLKDLNGLINIILTIEVLFQKGLAIDATGKGIY